MKKVHENDFDYRFGDNGPKYLTKGPNIDIGVVVLKPGQDFQNHYHTVCEEIFYILEGQIDFYINGNKVPTIPGDMIQCRPGDAHYLINQTDKTFKALFIKSPHILERDVVNIKNPEIKLRSE
ncbi:cupin domain-containing protein [Gottfriedia acidiceleris]|uniref:cupin domain-containing protein n=1 Tax=Gottfriedia acidiceleris TaxID=371036 RepID=UPI00101CCE00|nr:cupin domain-containing protein [Gottfriedia acidiceleris]